MLSQLSNYDRSNHIIKVGFDMDGVLLYNPARLLRPLISQLKKKDVCIHRKELEFYVPQTRWEEIIWELFHKSSIFVAPGLDQIQQYREQGLLDPYLITGRFAHLRKDFEKWQRKLNTAEVFNQALMNDQDEQPHLFKERKIKELGLEYFIEDNWDIVHYLSERLSGQCQIFWVTNIFDKKIDYPHKFRSLKQALAALPLKILK